MSKEGKTKGLFPFKPGLCTKSAHINYSQFPRSSEFETKYFEDTKEIAQKDLENIEAKKNTDYQAGITISTNRALRTKDREVKKPILEEQTKKPYFGRLDILNEEGDKETVYIGRNGMADDNDIRVYHILSAFGAIYNQSKIGDLSHDKLGEVTVNLKRQIESENGEFINFHDLKWDEEKGYFDPVLEKRLNDNAKEKLSEIWETIQAEQDLVMRKNISVPIFIQGSAGSGKTVIALHRISYLLYEHKNINPDKILIMAPNNMYLNYIKDISPDINKVNQSTFEEYCINRLPFKKNKFNMKDYFHYFKQNMEDDSEYLSIKEKGSIEYKNKLNDFLETSDFLEKYLPKEGINIEFDDVNFTFTLERIHKLAKDYIENSSFKVAKERVLKTIKQESKSKQGKKDWGFDDRGYERLIDKEILKLDKSWKIPSVFEIYFDFCTNIEVMKAIMVEEKAELIVENNKINKSKKLVTYDDLPALLFIQQKYFEGIGILHKRKNQSQPTQEGYDYVLVDEIQDYSPFHIFMIQQVVKNSRMTLLGDLGQGIFSPRGIDNWDTAFASLQGDAKDEYEYIELSTIYRSTLEIVNYANQILKPYSQDRYTLSNPIGREGPKPRHHKFNSMNNQLDQIISLCNDLDEQSFESIAIITKDWEEAFALYSGLKHKIKNVELVGESSKEITGGIIISPVYLTKGFEYDSVIIANASRDVYEDSYYSRKLLYVAVTRALHQVHVLYRNELTLPLMEIQQPSKAKNIREELKNNQKIKDEIDQSLETNKKSLITKVESELNTIFNNQAEEIYELKKKVARLEQEVEYYKKKYLKNKKG
ncbi:MULTISPECIES: UvrD-helicase domain-containing protein [Pontibacillus]|uniref:UvrD-like helicase ATP-binding domain-containing protein n=1 Tax=Pontibacillus marinus BH030004 = DSM 16465 TaxID=1385511 RepID=A0A0A5I2I7_9BACI|nr:MULTISPECIES: UvrD-helicase domain-containing protein [Pontibacillus]KGX90052.1 hypothetical protein N783_02515 [Pontibacillus marinus BH030004 = DSM 16465]QHE50897.1 UvrD-helicase domain-containing protein [Pontibacillus sp. HMF3514]